MPPVNFRPDLSFGNIITIVTMIVGLTIGWQVMASDVKENRTDLTKLESRVTNTETKLEKLVNDASEQRVQLTTVLTELRADMRYLRQSMDELKQAEGKTP
jgi:peptidoglycan hydrolase CwlO-like protein